MNKQINEIKDEIKLNIHFTDHFSGPDRALDLMCMYVCVCMRTITFKRNHFEIPKINTAKVTKLS